MADRETQRLAEDAARSSAVARARRSGRQLALFERPEPGGPVQDGDGDGRRGPGRPKGARNKIQTALRDLLASHGYRDPASALAHMAGLNGREDPWLVALGLAEALLDAMEPAGEGIERAEQLLEQARGLGDKAMIRRAMGNLLAAEAEERDRRAALPDLAMQVAKIMRQAQADLMPYVFPKVSPDDAAPGAQMVVQIAGPGTVQAGGQRVGPPAMPTPDNQGNQGVSGDDPEGSDGQGSDRMPNPLEPKGNPA